MEITIAINALSGCSKNTSKSNKQKKSWTLQKMSSLMDWRITLINNEIENTLKVLKSLKSLYWYCWCYSKYAWTVPLKNRKRSNKIK